ncbi:MAG: hypothetical protein SO016_03685 [Lachnospiraceae bacterium]|nr:hypothetical protein [Lachnospiraceae bacterium]
MIRSGNTGESQTRVSQTREGQTRKPTGQWKEKSFANGRPSGKGYERRNSEKTEQGRREESGKFRRENNRSDFDSHRPRPERNFQAYQKDEDEPNPKINRSSKSHAGKEKSSEPQLDKAELTSRWEKEKEKKLEKANMEKDRETRGVNAKHAVKKKRQNNIDWTREYENDSFDDDDAYYKY